MSHTVKSMWVCHTFWQEVIYDLSTDMWICHAHIFLSIETAAMQKEIVEEYQMQRLRSGEDVRGNTEEQK